MANEPNPDVPIVPDAPPAPVSITADAIKSAGIPDTYAKDGNYDLATIGKDLGELTTLRTAQAERAKLVPESADKYKFELPADWKPPENTIDGFKWSVSEHKVKALAPLAKEFGLSQDQLSKFLKEWANADAHEHASSYQESKKRFDSETAKLATHAGGIGAEKFAHDVADRLAGTLSIKQDLADAIVLSLPNADAHIALDALIKKANGPNVADKTHRGNGADKPDIDFNQPGVGDKLHRLARPASRQ